MTSIVRVGASNEDLSLRLQEALALFLSPQSNENTANATTPTTPPSGNACLLQISNKYFDATVALEPLQVIPTTTKAEEKSEGATTTEDGMLLIFDDASPTAFDQLSALFATAESNGQYGDLLRLCVGISGVTTKDAPTTLTEKQKEAEYSRRVLWCLDRGFEYVEGVDISSEENILREGHNDREKEGFARVVEALQGTVWSSAKMHAQTKQTLNQSYQQTQQQLSLSAKLNEDTKEEEELNEYEPPPSFLLNDEESKEREEQAKKALLEQDGITEDGDEIVNIAAADDMYLDGPATSSPTSVASRDNATITEREVQQADKIMSDMDNALKEANRIREMSRSGQLTDDDRKQRAVEAATLLMNLMTQMGGLEDDSENDDDEGGHSSGDEKN